MKNALADQLRKAKQEAFIAGQSDGVQTTIWLTVLALNDEFGFARERINRYADTIGKWSDDFAKDRKTDGDAVAFTRLANRVSQIMGVKYTYEG